MKLLRDRGYLVERTEYVIPKSYRKRDIWGFDCQGINKDHTGVLGVQATTKSNISSRWNKVLHLGSTIIWLQAGNQIEIHGWWQSAPRKTWQVEIRKIYIETGFGC